MTEPNLTEIVASTLRNRSGEFADNVSNGNALLQRLSKRGKAKPAAGGRTIVQELEYAENSTFMWYNGYETLNISPSKVFDAAEFAWKQAAVNVSWSGLETRVQNAGEEAVIDLMESRVKNAERTMKNKMSEGVYSDGTGTSGKQLGGLQLLVADDPTTGTVGGINRANFSFWRNQLYDFSVEGVTSSATTIQKAMRTLWLRCKRGQDKADTIVGDDVYYEYFWDSLTDIQRINRSDRGVAGFDSLAFNTADVIHDGDSGIPASHFYFLNTDFIYFRPHSATNMVPLTRRNAVDQDAGVVPVVFAGNMTASNLSLQGVMHE